MEAMILHGVVAFRRGGEFLEKASRILVLLFVLVQLMADDILARHIIAAATRSSAFSPLSTSNEISFTISPARFERPIPVNLPFDNREYTKDSLSNNAPSALPTTYILHYDKFSYVNNLSSKTSGLSPVQENHDPDVDLSLSPSPISRVSPADSNVSSVPFGPAHAPLPSETGCCEPNMTQRQDARDCYCVYPVKVELFLKNVSLSSDWSNVILQELASQLNLQVAQFEIINFYVFGASGINLTMYITPSTGISFTADEVSAMNNSLLWHQVQSNPDIGDYSLISLTWFRPLAPSPAPVVAVSSVASPSTAPQLPNPSSDTGNKNHSSLLIIIGVFVAIILTAIAVTALVCLCTSIGKKAEKAEAVKPVSSDAVDNEVHVPHPSSVQFLTYEELKEATNDFQPKNFLGEGGFGRVFKGALRDGTAVAIKKLSCGGHQGDKEFLVEVEMLSRLHHRNLVKLVGYCSSSDPSQNLLCYELVPNGSLDSWLHGPLGANCPLDWNTRMRIALDAAKGLAYLHEDSQPSVIHRDFKASNILLEHDFHAKISDFGLAKLAPEGCSNYLSTRVMGTFGYVAPEYAMTGHLLVKSDVYSYGVVLLEILTGRRPVDMSQPSGQENLVTWARPILINKDRLEELADPRLAGMYPKEDFVRVCTIAAACVAPEVNQRPTMGEVVQSLKMVQHVTVSQDSLLTPSLPHNRQSSTTLESDGTTSMFSSGPLSGLSNFENYLSGTAVTSEDLHEGR